MRFRPVPITPAPKKRTIWANCVEFVNSVKDYFEAKRLNKGFEQNYQKMVAATALVMLKKQREERKLVDEKLRAMSEILTSSVTQMNEQMYHATAENIQQMNKQLNEYETSIQQEIQQDEEMLEKLRAEQMERQKMALEQSTNNIQSGSSYSSNDLRSRVVTKHAPSKKSIMNNTMEKTSSLNMEDNNETKDSTSSNSTQL